MHTSYARPVRSGAPVVPDIKAPGANQRLGLLPSAPPQRTNGEEKDAVLNARMRIPRSQIRNVSEPTSQKRSEFVGYRRSANESGVSFQGTNWGNIGSGIPTPAKNLHSKLTLPCRVCRVCPESWRNLWCSSGCRPAIALGPISKMRQPA